MGSGKSSLGKKLAAKLGLPFTDLDHQIETVEKAPISAIFDEQGEDAFRMIERQQLHTLEEIPPHVVALGGGTPCFFDNMEFCNEHGVTVYLRLPVGMLASRLQPGAKDRPLLAGKTTEEIQSFLEEQLETRKEYYEQAQLIIDNPGSKSVGEIADMISAKL